jgi:hypothetical protein
MRHTLIFIVSVGIATGALLGADIAPAVRTLQVHPSLPPLEIRLLPAPEPTEASPSPHLIGRVEITHRGETEPFQTLEVTGYGSPAQLVSFSRFEDANFDGYADLLLGNDGGAKWVGYEVYVYDPESGTFVQNQLSHEMSKHLGGLSLTFHAATRELVVTHLSFGCQNGFVGSETFAIQGSSLRIVEEQDYLLTQEGCYAVKLRSQDTGGLEEVSRERVPNLDRTSE